MIADLSPGLILIVGALVAPVLRGRARAVWLVFLPIFALLHLASLPAGDAGRFELMGIALTTLRVDGLSRVFGYGFLVALLLGLIYALHVRDAVQQVAALILAGSAIGGVFAGDLVTLFFFWAGAAVSSVFLIWATRTEAAYRSGMRYLLIQVLGALLLFEGVLHFHHDYGTIAFDELSLASMGGWMILAAFGIAAAFPVLHLWLPDAYAKATPTGTVFLSAFTTKLAVYALARAFPGAEMLIAIGAAMVVLGLVLAAIADDLRRVVAYVLISQVGVMVIGVGIGTELALNGVAVFAFAHVLAIMLLFMVAGAVIACAGSEDAAALGGLYRAMPWTAGFAALAALSLAAPLFGGFVGHAQLVAAAAFEGHGWAWLALVAGGAGAFAVVSLKLVQFVFFGGGRDARAEEAPANMTFAMALAATVGLAAGLFPGWVFAMLPYDITYDAYALGHVVAQLQLLAFAGLAVVLAVRLRLYPRPMRGTTLDIDWVFRRPGRAAALGALAGGRRMRGAAMALLRTVLAGFVDRIYRYMGPGGILARNWPTGVMAFWTTVLLAVWLLAYFV